jgi:ribosomal protein S18 acetylase RimI-like enzyme
MIIRRPARADEREWLFQLHKAVMRERVESLFGPWDDERQRERFSTRDPRNTTEIIEADGVRAGAIHWRITDGSLYIDLIEVRPEFQSRGIGGQVLLAACREAAASGMDATLQVRKGNPARRLYERLGFVTDGSTETHFLMRRSADS